jgi:hypothetical protein
MSLIKITDHVQQAQDRLVEQYKESVNLNNLIEAVVLPIQDIENQTDELYRLRLISTAYGVQLDKIGTIIGEARFGRNDSDYRSAIITRININVSGGEPESIISAIRQIIGPFTIEYIDIFPAYFQIFMQTVNFVPNVLELIEPLNPAGVGSCILLQGGNESPFVFSELSSEPSEFFVQSGNFNNDEVSDLELVFSIGNDYNLGVEIETITEDLTGDGFAEIYLNEAILLIDGAEYDIGDGNLLELDLSEANEDYTVSSFGGELVEVIAI